MALAARQEKQDSSSRYIDDPAAIESAFRQLRDQRTKLQLRFDGVATTYSASVLDIADGGVLVEDIVPRSGLSHIRQGTTFSLIARGQGVYMYVEGLRSTRSDAERGIPYFWLKLPQRVLYQQRRQSTRVDLPLRVKAQGARIKIVSGKLELIGDILDLSAGGVRAQFLGQTSTALRQDQQLDRCTLHIRHQLELKSQATVRHALLDQRNSVLKCGVELTQMSVTDRRRLEQYVESLTKQVRKGSN